MLLPLVIISISSLVHGVAAEDCRVPYISNGRIEAQVQDLREFDLWPELYERKMRYKKIPMGSIPSNRATLFLVCQKDDFFLTLGASRIQVTCSDGKWSQDLVCHKSDCTVPYISNGHIEEQVQRSEKYNFLNLPRRRKMKYKKIPVGSSPSKKAVKLFLVCHKNHLDLDLGKVSRIQITCSDGKWSNIPNCIKTTCQDPGPIANGKAEPTGSISNIFDVGESIEFSCQDQYDLNGEKSISCTSNGTWSAKKPECIKVDLPKSPSRCENPPVPKAGFVTYLAPLKTPFSQMSAMYQSRLSHSFSAANPPVSTDSMQKVGTVATYGCESRYYKLIGSKARRCQESGEWSGRPPICMPVCGRSDSHRTTFIANGNSTEIGQWPWQVRITRDSDGWIYSCGASLLNEMWLITAAHCVTEKGTTVVHNPDEFQAYMGKYYRKNLKDDEYVQVKKIREIHVNPDYDPITVDADIALMQLDSPVQLNTRVQPICLPTEETTRENLVEGKKGVITGWGKDENGKHLEILQQAVLPVVSQARCVKGFKDADLDYAVTDNMFCAGYADGRSDSCSGDSGGPMVFTDPTSNERRWVLEGIVSWGSSQGCAKPNQYGVYTTVSKFLDWIHLYF